MKKGMRHFITWVLLWALLCSSVAPATASATREFEVNPLFIVSEEEGVLCLTNEMAEEDGTILIKGGVWERIIVYRTLEADKIVLQEVEAEVLAVESGKEYQIELINSKISELVVAGPQTGELGVLTGTYNVQVGITTKGTTEIEKVSVSGGAAFDFAEGNVGSVEVETKEAYCILFVDIKNYEGTVAVEHNNVESDTSLWMKVDGSELTTLTMTGEGGKCNVSGVATVETMTIESSSEITINVDIENVVIAEEADGVEVELYSTVGNLDVQADESKIILVESAEVAEASVAGDSVQIHGDGELNKAEVLGESANISVQGTEVIGENDTTPPEAETLSTGVAATPTKVPSVTPTVEPTAAPTAVPTAAPTEVPMSGVVTVTEPSGGTMEITLDEAGQMTTQVRYDVNGVKIGENQVVYEAERLSNIYCYDTEGTKIGEVRVTYHYSLGYVYKRIAKGESADSVAVISVNVDDDGTATAEFFQITAYKELAINYLEDGSKRSSYEAFYDEAGKELESFSYDAEGSKTSWERYEYYEDGGTKKRTTEYYEQNVFTGLKITEYDTAGNRINWEEYDADNNLTFRTTSEYDENGNNTSVTFYNENNLPKQENLYDENQNVVESTDYIYDSEWKLISCLVKIYDANGNILTSTQCDALENLIYKITCEYYDTGTLKKRTQENYESGVLTDYDVYEYDEEGRILEHAFYDGNKNLLSRSASEYDENGNKLSITYYNENNLPKQKNLYDEAGNMVKRIDSTYDANGELESYLVRTYDAQGNQLTSTMYDSNNNLVSESFYEYYEDGSKKQWTEDAAGIVLQYEIYNEQGILTERKVTYYDDAGNFAICIVSEFYEDGTPKQETDYREDGQVSSRHFYNAEGVLTSETYYSYDENGISTGSIVTEYDSNKETSTTYDANNVMVRQSLREYYANGNIKKRTQKYYESGVLTDYYVNEYDEEEKILEYASYDGNNNLLSRSAYEYDENGNKLSITYYNENNLPKQKNLYDEAGNMVKRIDSTYDANGELESYLVRTYDAQGNELTSSKYDALDNLIDTTTYEYYDTGTLKQRTTRDAEGVLTGYIKYNEQGTCVEKLFTSYDEEGNPNAQILMEYYDDGTLKKKEYYESGVLIDYAIYEYDEEGRILEHASYDGNNNLLFRTAYEYDENGNKLSITDYNENNLPTQKYFYDEAGNMVKRIDNTYDAQGELESYHVRTYDAQGNELTSTKYDALDNPIETSTYEYYDDGTLKKRTTCDAEGVLTGYTEYNEQGTRIESKQCYYDDTSGLLLSSEVQKYNDNGMTTENIHYDADDNIQYRSVFEYYEDGITMKQWTYYDSEGEITTYEKYNEEGIKTERKNVYTAGTVTYSICLYDAEGKESTRTDYDANNNIWEVTTYEYYAGGTIKQYTSRNADGILWGWGKYNEAGGLIEYTTRGTYLGTNNEILSWTLRVYYYDNGEQIKYTETEYDSNGNAVSETVTYDNDGNIITE